MMKKKQSIAVLLIMLVVTVLLGYTVVAGWGSKHTGSMKNIRTGLDLSGGVSITYATNCSSVCSSTVQRRTSISRG